MNPQFRSFVQDLALKWRHMSAGRIQQMLLIRLELWRDGHHENAIPGYQQPPAAGRAGYPAGWSVRSIRNAIAATDVSPRTAASTSSH
jgi:hypothetical protein